MPNISFDIFYDQDILNFTATRAGAVPKVKPEWKVKSAPKLAPKDVPVPKTGPRPRIQKVVDAPAKKTAPKLDTASNAGDAPKKAAPKLNKVADNKKVQEAAKSKLAATNGKTPSVSK